MIIISALLLLGYTLGCLAAPQAKQSCSENVLRLLTGIQKNIDAQRGERASVDTIGRLIEQTDAPPEQLTLQKSNLLQFIDQGIQIRKENQMLAQGNKVEAGLAKVEMAQAMELQLAQTISGSKNSDAGTVKTLQMMFDGGIKQNMQNSQDATADCVVGRV